jgi:UrcA family protein
MLHWTSSPHLVPYLMFAAAWAFVCGLIIASVPAHGQPNAPPAAGGKIIIEAPQMPAPGQYYGELNSNVISLSQPVSYADIDLSKPGGAAELEKRINDMAHNVCRKLSQRYPRTLHQLYIDKDCVKSAVDQAMPAARRVIAAAG